MIEFKADCGHTVRAKDADSEKVVRCAYCGKETRVPSNKEEELDFLFSEIGQDGAEPSAAVRKTRGARRGPSRRPRRTSSGVDPFRIITKMAYVAVILIVLIFVGRTAWPTLRNLYLQFSEDKQEPTPVVKKDKPRQERSIKQSTPSKKYGLLNPRLDRRGKQGIYVASIPAVAEVRYKKGHGERGRLDWLNDPNTRRLTTPAMIDADPGDYTVVVTLAINDKQLKKSYRNARQPYNKFRGDVEEQNKTERADSTVNDYFMPDSACAVKAIPADQIILAREYHVTVRSHGWTVLTSLFVPDLSDMREIASYVPRQVNYGFDEVDIRDELEHYKVRTEDHDYIVDILHRIGMIAYWQETDGRYRLLRIDPENGSFSAKYLPEPARKRRDWKSGA